MTLDQWISIAAALSQFMIAIAAFLLGWRVHKYGQLAETLNQVNAVLESTNQLNALALSSEENLKAIDRLYSDGRDQSVEAARKRWATFFALQTHQQFFLARRFDLIPSDVGDNMKTQVLDLLLKDPEVVSLLVDRGFDSDFVAFCQNRAQKVAQRAHENAQQ